MMKVLKIVVKNDKQPTNVRIVLSLNDDFDNIKEVMSVKGDRYLNSFLFCDHIEKLIE